ncbi:MAG TPA: AbrB/MazE/SpoVT family DNA-binding domain-containing protein [Desulfuromonadales bacterium]|nr:AbrB/MazE/SpoVT family DNA-binding domain-containing protein [Desulfuromonadales bacterium]
MESVALSSKGQFVLPKSVRDRHHWQAGTRLVVIDRGEEVVIKSAEPFAATTFEAPDAPSVYRGTRLSLDDMKRAVAAEAGTQA